MLPDHGATAPCLYRVPSSQAAATHDKRAIEEILDRIDTTDDGALSRSLSPANPNKEEGGGDDENFGDYSIFKLYAKSAESDKEEEEEEAEDAGAARSSGVQSEVLALGDASPPTKKTRITGKVSPQGGFFSASDMVLFEQAALASPVPAAKKGNKSGQHAAVQAAASEKSQGTPRPKPAASPVLSACKKPAANKAPTTRTPTQEPSIS